MSSTVTWQADKGNTTRKSRSSGATAGAGDCKRHYVGNYDGFQRESFLHFTPNWSGVGRIVSATLTLYADDGFGILGDTMPAGSPLIYVRKLTAAFSEGTASATYDTDDYTNPANTSSGAKQAEPSRGSLDAANIDITAIVRSWAPSTVTGGSGSLSAANARNHGIKIYGTASTGDNYAYISEDAEAGVAAYKPIITIVYELGPTTPTTPTNLTPVGAQDGLPSFQGDFDDPRSTDTLARSNVQIFDAEHTFSSIGASDTVSHTAHGLSNGDVIYFTRLVGGTGLSTFTKYYVRQKAVNTFKVATANTDASIVDVTVQYTDGGWSKLLYNVDLPESNTAILSARFDHVASFPFVRGDTYRWRARVRDQEGQYSAFTALTSFSINNTQPDPPVLVPDAATYASLDGVHFTGSFTDDDPGDQMLAYQVQMSALPEGDPGWDEDESILWNTGKKYVILDGRAGFDTTYGGASLDTGTYYWRARVWDSHDTVSEWEYASVILSDDFETDPATSVNAIQLRPRAPWRIVIRNMFTDVNDTVPTTGRGPGRVVAIIEDAMNVGASMLYNSPGEAHWTLGKNHPQLSVIEPKQTHYAIEFRQGDGWREVFQGLVWDFDASDTDIIFYGIDYLGLLDMLLDEKFVAANLDADYLSGGSKYTNKTISVIVADQLTRARRLSNSPVGFITNGSIATMSTILTVYSTFQPVLNFVAGLLDAHRAGSGKFTRLSVRKSAAGAYTWNIEDDPGTVRDNLRLRYGELVQGYRVVPFGNEWGTRVSAIGRDKSGIKVRYKNVLGGVSEALYGRYMRPAFIENVIGDTDLTRRARQQAISNSMLGKGVALGLRSGVLQPRDGYDLLDRFPVDIEHGAVSTTAFGHDGYWVAVGITWTALQRGDFNTTLTLRPKESGTPPSADLLAETVLSAQAEWQLGWTAPPATARSRYWYDMSTGKGYERTDGDTLLDGITGTP